LTGDSGTEPVPVGRPGRGDSSMTCPQTIRRIVFALLLALAVPEVGIAAAYPLEFTDSSGSSVRAEPRAGQLIPPRKGKAVKEMSSWENKTLAQCKQCGRTFMRYVYEKLVRCEACRKANRLAALPPLEQGARPDHVTNPRPLA